MNFEDFHYEAVKDVLSQGKKNGILLQYSGNLDVLKRPVKIGNLMVPNALAFHPMEGCDGKIDGGPDELTVRRYTRFARGGAGLIWFEAVAVVPEGRANPRQLWIKEENAAEFQRLFDLIMQNARAEYGQNFSPVCIMQLTHSGRYSKPFGKSKPILAAHNPYLDPLQKIGNDLPVIGDDELEQLEDKYAEAAVLAKRAGFHGVDIKGCHRYLNSELLSGFTRKGKYGETFEGRTRFLLNIIDKIKARLGDDFIITSRMNVYDGIPYPYGWGVSRSNEKEYDLDEPVKLLKILYDKGIKLVNLTMGNPYYNPHINRPYDKGNYVPEENPLKGVARLINGIGEAQMAVPKMAIVGTGYTWLRHLSPYFAAGSIENGKATFIGYGRESFAYPDFAKDILYGGGMKRDKCCITCGKCVEIMRAGGTTGCVIRDGSVYAPIYNKYCRVVKEQ